MKYLIIEDKTELINLLEILEINKSNNKMIEEYRTQLIKLISKIIKN